MSDWSKLEKLANDYVAQFDGDDDDLYQEARDMFEDACDTTTILAMIKEIKILRRALQTIREESNDLGACECAADALIDSRKI